MKSLMNRLVVCLGSGLIGFSLSACHGGWKDDVELPESIQPDKKPEEPQPKAVAKDSLQIDVDRFYEFAEGEEHTITIGGRSAFPSSRIELEVITMDQTPGATQDFVNNSIEIKGVEQEDPRTGTLTLQWTPDEFFVSEDLEKRVRMRVELRATVDGLSVYRTEKEFMIFVRRRLETPEVVSIQGLDAPIREGQSRKFEVKVRDPDSLNGVGAAVAPELRVLDHKSDSSAGGYLVTVSSQKPEQDISDKSLWTYSLLVNTGNRELVPNSRNFEFSLQAISRFERVSSRKKGVFTVWNKVTEPLTTWNDTVEFEEGVENIYSFTVFDRKAEGMVDVLWQSRCNDLPGPSVCKCTERSSQGVKICSIRWKPQNLGSQRSFRISYEGINKSRLPRDEDYAKQVWQGVIRVKSRGPSTSRPDDSLPPPPPPVPAARFSNSNSNSLGGQL